MIGVLVSGEGTNLQALIDADLPIAGVASNRAGVRALERAEAASIPVATFPIEEFATREARDGAMADWLEEREVRFVVLAGYMHLLRPNFLARFPGKVVNTHSAPLPGSPVRTRSRTCSRRGWPRRPRRFTTWTTESIPAR